MHKPSFNEQQKGWSFEASNPHSGAVTLHAAYAVPAIRGHAIFKPDVGAHSLRSSHAVTIPTGHQICYGILMPIDLDKRDFYFASISATVWHNGILDCNPIVAGYDGGSGSATSPRDFVAYSMLPQEMSASRSGYSHVSYHGALRPSVKMSIQLPTMTGLFIGALLTNMSGSSVITSRFDVAADCSRFTRPDSSITLAVQ